MESETDTLFSPNQSFSVKAENHGEFRMDAYRIDFTLPFSVAGQQVFHTVNGQALFLNDRWLIIRESKLTLLLDLEKKKAFHQDWIAGVKLDGDVVKLFTKGVPPIVRSKVDNIVEQFIPGLGTASDGILPMARESSLASFLKSCFSNNESAERYRARPSPFLDFLSSISKIE